MFLYFVYCFAIKKILFCIIVLLLRERAVYLGLDEKNLTAKFVAGTKVL